MSQNLKLELISFKVCPFVQRSIIALNEKQIDFKLIHIEPGNSPDWFKEISPLGKVPVLRVGDQPIFESAVILEYLDEVYAPHLHPRDPLEKALHRSWIEFCSELVMMQFRMFTAKDKESFEENRDALKQGLQRLDQIVAKEGSFFAGDTFTLVDTVYAPLFLRLNIVEAMYPLNVDLSERLQVWSQALLARDTVKHSVVDDFESIFMTFLQKQEGYLFS